MLTRGYHGTDLTLPQPELPVFTGDPIEYCDFIRAFENLVERKTSSSSARLYYLLQYTSGHVKDLVRSCLTMRESKMSAIVKQEHCWQRDMVSHLK